MDNSWTLWFHILNLRIAMHSIAAKSLENDAYEIFDNLDRQMGIALDLLKAGEKEFSWQKAHEKGLLCENDYKKFPALVGKDPYEFVHSPKKG